MEITASTGAVAPTIFIRVTEAPSVPLPLDGTLLLPLCLNDDRTVPLPRQSKDRCFAMGPLAANDALPRTTTRRRH
jgi:hypothetical protein